MRLSRFSPRCRRVLCAPQKTEYVIQGLGHNVPFLRDVSRNQDFTTGDYSTSFIDKHYPDG